MIFGSVTSAAPKLPRCCPNGIKGLKFDSLQETIPGRGSPTVGQASGRGRLGALDSIPSPCASHHSTIAHILPLLVQTPAVGVPSEVSAFGALWLDVVVAAVLRYDVNLSTATLITFR